MSGTLILGAGGTGRDIVDWLPELHAAGRPLEIVGFLDDDPAKQGTSVAGRPVLGTLSDLPRFGDVTLVDALGSPRTYRQRVERLAGIRDERFTTLVHPLARVSPGTILGVGTLIYPFVFVGPGVTLGRHVTVLSHTALNHDVVIGDFSILASQVAVGGGVRIGTSCYVGMRAALREGISIGSGAMIGMGAVATADVAAGTTVIGVPARPSGR